MIYSTQNQPYYRYSALHGVYLVFANKEFLCCCKTLEEAKEKVEEEAEKVVGFGDHVPAFIVKDHGYKFQNVS